MSSERSEAFQTAALEGCGSTRAQPTNTAVHGVSGRFRLASDVVFGEVGHFSRRLS